MKNLKELSINAEKVINNDELINLRGGYIKKWGYYKCCWDDQPTNCSSCSWTNDPQCVDGAHSVPCE